MNTVSPMTRLIASEALKLRTVRSTYLVFAAALACVVLGTLLVATVVGAWDAAPAHEKSGFEAADPTVVVMPFIGFCVSMLGCLAITSEYSTGAITTSLIAVPRRGRLLAAKLTVVTVASLVAGLLLACMVFASSLLVLGDRPAPINPWNTPWDAIPSVLSTSVGALLSAVVGFGVGAVLRSSAAALLTMCVLQLVMPIFGHFLPQPMGIWASSLMLPNLPPQLSGAETAYQFSPAASAALMAGYATLAVTAGWIAMKRRDV